MTDSYPKPSQSGTYVLGHSDRELDRLSAQARLLNPITTRFLREAGIVRGMRVLDVGTGVGDVSFVAADLVGDKGEVIGVDREPTALAVARSRANAASLTNVSFCEGDPSEMAFEQPFDAIIGRYVLLFQKNPTQMLQKLVPHVKLGGVIAFHEPNVVAHSYPVSPMWDRCCQWVAETFRQNSNEMQMGGKLFSTFLAVGLPPPEVRVEAILRGGANSYDLVNWIVGLVGTLLPSMERLGIVAAADVDLETLAARMTDEIVANASVVMRHLEVGAWCRK